MTQPAIRVQGLSKRYRIGQREARQDTLAGAILSTARKPFGNLKRLRRLAHFDAEDSKDTLWALREVDFEVERGHAIGIIGRNGAGKTTLLKILSRITSPTAGRIELAGRVASLLEVGTGFHPELTGRENIFLNGTILGMRRAEVQDKLDAIVAFSGIERFLDTPIKRYSSGMAVRLAFSVAAHLEPEILLIDEVLAVGDAEFRKRCLGKMRQVAHEGRTVLFVSHNLGAIAALTTDTILLSEGRIAFRGDTQTAIQEHLAVDPHGSAFLETRSDRDGDGSTRLVALRIESLGNGPGVTSGSRLAIHLEYERASFRSRVDFLIDLRDGLGTKVFHLSSEGSIRDRPTRGWVTCQTGELRLGPGTYYVDVAAVEGNRLLDRVQSACSLEVVADADVPLQLLRSSRAGLCLLPQAWHVSKETPGRLADGGDTKSLHSTPPETL